MLEHELCKSEPEVVSCVGASKLASHTRGRATERDSWARVKSGMYKDDLARVIDVDYSTGRATIEVSAACKYYLCRC